ncbi:hypothetical protein Tco_0172638 [Tanacetum coccineum]
MATSSKPADLNEAVRMAHKLMEQKPQARDERIWKGRSESGRAFKVKIVVVRAIKRITLVKLCRIAKSKGMHEPWLPLLLMESFLCVNDKYGYIKNHKKTVKNRQARTRERKSKEKPEAKPGKVKPSVKSSQQWSTAVNH